jgi:hypothetical protein
MVWYQVPYQRHNSKAAEVCWCFLPCGSRGWRPGRNQSVRSAILGFGQETFNKTTDLAKESKIQTIQAKVKTEKI